MKLNVLLLVPAAFALGACTTTASTEIGNVPEGVTAIAAPYQDLSTARLRNEDGCYWYMHDGPVENTLLPLRTAAGNPICARTQL